MKINTDNMRKKSVLPINTWKTGNSMEKGRNDISKICLKNLIMGKYLTHFIVHNHERYKTSSENQCDKLSMH